MHTSVSSQYLEIMGIQTWQSRHVLPGSSQPLDFSAYTLHDTANQLEGVLCLESQLIPAGQEAPLFRLLDAMLSAIQLKRTPAQEGHILKTTALIIVMGEKLAQAALASDASLDELRRENLYTHQSGAKLLVTYHPLRLLLEPAYKAKAWEDLKKVPPIFSSNNL